MFDLILDSVEDFHTVGERRLHRIFGGLADRAYGARAIREYISAHGASYVIPPQSNVSDPWPVDWHLYKERHLVECFFQKIKWFRRIATRYDKSDASFLAFVYLASIAILLL